MPPLVYIDTNVFILGFEGPTSVAEPVRRFLWSLREFPGAAITSELTLAELTAPAASTSVIDIHARRQIYSELLILNSFIEMHEVSRGVLVDTSMFRQMAAARGFRPKLPDSIHVVTAARAGCRYVMSYDARLRPLEAWMKAISASDESIETVMRELRAR